MVWASVISDTFNRKDEGGTAGEDEEATERGGTRGQNYGSIPLYVTTDNDIEEGKANHPASAAQDKNNKNDNQNMISNMSLPVHNDATMALTKYPGYDFEQAQLLCRIDRIIESPLEIPTLSISSSMALLEQGQDYAVQAKQFVISMIKPTIASLCTLVVAIYIEKYEEVNTLYTEQAEVVNQWMIFAFPYINAVIVFAASIRPIHDRFMKFARPIFHEIDRLEHQADISITKTSKRVDRRIDTLQQQTMDVIQPLRPTLDKATTLEKALRVVDPEIDIPDPQDINREYDSMQGVITGHIDHARKYIKLDTYVPVYIRTPDSFYRGIILPVVMLALFMQLVFAWVTSYLTTTSQHPTNSTTTNSIYTTTAGDDMSQHRKLFNQLTGTMDTLADNFTTTTTDLVDNYKDYVADMKHNISEELYEQYEESLSDAQSLVYDVAVSYAIAVLQMAVIYMLTNPRVRIWLLERTMRILEHELAKTLEQYGVVDAANDVFGTKLAKIRKQLLLVIDFTRKVQAMIDQLGPATDTISKLSSDITSLGAQVHSSSTHQQPVDDTRGDNNDGDSKNKGILGQLMGFRK